MKKAIKRGEEKVSKQWIIFVSIVSVLVASGLYQLINRLIIHTDSFVLETIITLAFAYIFTYGLLFIEGSKS